MTKQKPIMRIAARAAALLPASFKRLLYRVPFLAKWIRHVLNAAAPEGLARVQIAAGPAKGLFMELDLHAEKDYWLGTYEPDLQNAAEKLASPGNTFYDVGANIGYISLMCANLTSQAGRVFAFEALPANIARLQKNVAMNGLSEQIIITHAAVIDSEKEVTFFTHASGAMGKAQGSAGRDEIYSDSIKVKGISLDHFTFDENNPKPDLIKMDIEGGEGNALLGARRLLSGQKPALLIELHGEHAARQAWDILAGHGYHIHLLQRGFPVVTDVNTLDWKAYILAMHPNNTFPLT